MTSIKGIKVTDSERRIRVGIAVKTLAELTQKTKEKFKLKLDESEIRFQAPDGTIIETDEYFQTLEAQTLLIWVKAGEKAQTDAEILYRTIREVNEEYLTAGEKVQEFFTEKMKNKVFKLAELLKEVGEDRIEESERKLHPEWFEGLDTTARTKEEYMARRAQDRVRTYYYRTKDELVKNPALPSEKLSYLLKDLQERLKRANFFGCYFDRRALESICDRKGNFSCEGRWDKTGCLYVPVHSINPYRSSEERIVFQTWNLDHGIERSRAILPAICEALKHDEKVNGKKRKVVDVQRIFDDLFTRNNLKFVHIVCHDKGAHDTKIAGENLSNTASVTQAPHPLMSPFLTRIYFRLSVAAYGTEANSNLLKVLSSMPRDPKHIAEAQKARKKIKEKSTKYAPGRVTLQVLGTGAEGAPRSLYVFSDQSRYLFNCGEGTQRLAHEHKMKLAKLEHIFITQPVWKNIGGLPGTALTIQDVGVPQVTLHGPQGLDELFVATKRFVIIKNLHIKMAECTEKNEFSDNVMTVQYVPLERAVKKEDEYTIVEAADVCDDDSNSDGTSYDKNTQAGSSFDTSEASTSTKSSRRKRGRSRKNSQSVGRYSKPDVVEDNTDYYAHERKRSRRRRRARSQSVSGTREPPQRISESSQIRLSEVKQRGTSMAYVCRLKPRPGALNLDKCVRYGVPAGPLLGRLKNGENVTLESGVVVRPADVCEPDDPGPVFIVIECPTEEYLDSLLENMKLKKYQKYADSTNDCAHLVVHFTPNSVVCHPKYQAWLEDFPPSTQHLMLNDKNTCMGSVAVHRIQYKLNLLSRTMFPLLGDKGSQVSNEQNMTRPSPKKIRTESESMISDESDETQCESLSVGSVNTLPFCNYLIQANTFCSYHLRPRKGLDRSGELKLVPSEYIDETVQVEGFRSELQKLKINILNKSLGAFPRQFPKVLFLGTGSCIPNKTRNTSGILLETSDECKILVDCGEGTYGQIMRFFGPEKSLEILINTRAIYISHLHADHHIGLIGFLLGRRKALNDLQIDAPPVILFAPKQILNWLVFYDRCFESFANDFDIVPNGDIILGEEIMTTASKEKILKRLNLTNINTVLVRHCPNAFGVAFTHADGYKITYSGDTMPCPNLVKLGKDSDLLIHEATMEDELAAEAVLKMHSTTSQAISMGQQMGAKYTLLTHFSQRYAKLPRFNENFSENVGIAFDNMQVKLDELHLVPLLYPALKIMFAEHYEELEHKAVKRQKRIERLRENSAERKSLQKV